MQGQRPCGCESCETAQGARLRYRGKNFVGDISSGSAGRDNNARRNLAGPDGGASRDRGRSGHAPRDRLASQLSLAPHRPGPRAASHVAPLRPGSTRSQRPRAARCAPAAPLAALPRNEGLRGGPAARDISSEFEIFAKIIRARARLLPDCPRLSRPAGPPRAT